WPTGCRRTAFFNRIGRKRAQGCRPEKLPLTDDRFRPKRRPLGLPNYRHNLRHHLDNLAVGPVRFMGLIASEVGHESRSALARAFRRKTGNTPSEWLQRKDA
ncbi:TPA: AraC family transcriptional regulator, partial [Pseudomonas aeruginosa]